MADLPEGFHSIFVDCGEVRLHAVTNGMRGADGELYDDHDYHGRPIILFLHGFPEYWAGWKPVFTRLASDYLVIAPDQRGYNLSDAPQEVEAYTARKLAADQLALASSLVGTRKFILAGHDWGASVAYALAIAAPERLNGLVVANGVHPIVFQRALLEDPEQAAASQYIHILRAPQAAELLAEDNYAKALAMLENFSITAWMNDDERAGYREAWSHPGRLNAMLNWYRAAPLVVPEPGEKDVEAPLADAPADKFQLPMPHLLIWGAADQALKPSSTAGLEDFAPHLERVEIADADHWLIHTHAETIAREIDRFAAGLAE
ncbi:MAG: alpha/beta hydrolase [Salaquimonas sp.]|nr:alpha/beta hydrolase [Salaquimonas sp.]